MDAQVRKLFERYERLFRKSLAGDADMDEVTSVYASAFIAASPAGIMVGKNDDQLKQAMEQRLCSLSSDRHQGDANTRCWHFAD